MFNMNLNINNPNLNQLNILNSYSDQIEQQFEENNLYEDNSYDVIDEYEQITANRVNELNKLNTDKFLCLICHTILINPIKCKLCKYHFCNVCITQWLKVKNKCPHCLGVNLFDKPEHYLRLDLNLLIDCKYKSEGCKEYRKLKYISDHVIKCGYQSIQCEHCSTNIYSKDMDEHLKLCNKNKESWKMYDYYIEQVGKLEKGYKYVLNKLTNEYKMWIKIKQFKLKQLKMMDEVQKNVINELELIKVKKSK